MSVIKRGKDQSAKDLAKALEDFIFHLEGQKEDEAVTDLRFAIKDIQSNPPGSTEFISACDLVRQAFGDKHELDVYTQPRKSKQEGEWNDADELYMSSTKVLALLKRF